MIIASIEFATVTQVGDRGWNSAYVPIDINPFIMQPAHHKVVPHHPRRLRPVRNMKFLKLS